MSWTQVGDAITVTSGGVSTSMETTSTSTIVADLGGGRICLRMFLNSPGPLTSEDISPAPADTGEVEQGDDNIGYIESTSADEATATASDLLFEIQSASDTGDPPYTKTCVPSKKTEASRPDKDGALTPCDVLYKDAHVLELPDDRGWLMLLARYHRPSSEGAFGSGAESPGPNNSISAIVAFWAPNGDSSFTSPEVKGPYWIVSAAHEVDGDTAYLWLGVPAAVVVEEEAEEFLYVYYTAEDSSYLGISNAEGGTRLRKIALNTLLDAIGEADEAESASPTRISWSLDWSKLRYDLDAGQMAATAAATGGPGAAGASVARSALTWASRSTRGRIPGSKVSASGVLPGVGIALDAAEEDAGGSLSDAFPWTDEEVWFHTTGAGLIPGEAVGKVRVWVATGTEFEAGDDPDADDNGNTQMEYHYYRIYTVDAVPTVCSGQLLLFFSGNFHSAGAGAVTNIGWGIWRASVVDTEGASPYGLDFVVHEDYYDDATPVDLILPVGPEAVAGGGDPAPSYLRVDPDPVELPDGSWLVFSGTTDSQALTRLEGESADVCKSASEAWR